MPYKFESEKLLIPKEHDKRRKLSEEDKTDIKRLYERGEYSQRGLARLYGVSRRLIQFIIDPIKHEENLQRRKERGGSAFYYDKDKQRSYMKTHREHKKQLNNNSLLIENKNKGEELN